jgi:tetratricopeptide (TPR) repeat protein
VSTEPNDNLALQEKFTRAAQSYESGNIKEADTLYSELLQQHKNSHELLIIAGKIAFELADYGRAIDHLSKAIIINPNDAMVLFLLGKSLLAKGKQKAAEMTLQKAVVANPEFNPAWCMLGDIYIQQNKLGEAHKIFLQVIARDKTYHEAYSQLAVIFNTKNSLMTATIFKDLFHHYHPSPTLNKKTDEIYDTFFIDRNIAHNTAIQNSRIQQTLAVTAPQICYYQGEPFDKPPANLIQIPENETATFFSSTRLRRPSAIHFNPENIQETNKALKIASDLDKASALSKEKALHDAQSCKAQKPKLLKGEPLKILLNANRTTTVMQYCAKNLSTALQRKGCNTYLLTEEDDMESIEMHQYLEECVRFNPNAVVHINEIQNEYINEDTYNIIWWQDLMPVIESGKPIHWRERDLVLSICPQFDPYLYRSGANKVYRQDFCIDQQIFFSDPTVERQEKIVFIGSSYINRGHISSKAGKQIIAVLKEKMVNGEDISDQLLHELSEKFGLKFIDIFENILPFVARDTSVEWLCSIADTLGYKVEVYGRWWEKNPIVAPFFEGELPHGPMVAKVYNEAKYALSVIHRLVTSQRLSEIAACGCIPVVFDQRMYKEAEPPHWDDECLFYKSKDELRDCIGRSPKNDPQIISKGYSYDSFADKIIEYIKNDSYPAQPVKKSVFNL